MSNDPNDSFGPRGAAPSATPSHDPDAIGTVEWINMPPTARATGCLAALLASWPIDTAAMRFDPRKGIVFVTRSAARDPALPPSARRQVISKELLALPDAIAYIRAGFGIPREVEVRKLIARR